MVQMLRDHSGQPNGAVFIDLFAPDEDNYIQWREFPPAVYQEALPEAGAKMRRSPHGFWNVRFVGNDDRYRVAHQASLYYEDALVVMTSSRWRGIEYARRGQWQDIGYTQLHVLVNGFFSMGLKTVCASWNS